MQTKENQHPQNNEVSLPRDKRTLMKLLWMMPAKFLTHSAFVTVKLLQLIFTVIYFFGLLPPPPASEDIICTCHLQAIASHGHCSATTMATKLATSLQWLWRTAMFCLFCKFQWDCYIKWADGKIATASTSKQAGYQRPFAISMCPLDYQIPEVDKEVVKLSKLQ